MTKHYLPQYTEEQLAEYDDAYDEGQSDAQECAAGYGGIKNDYEPGSAGHRGYDHGVRSIRSIEREDVEDTPSLESGRHNCDDWGTGEGMYHGRI